MSERYIIVPVGSRPQEYGAFTEPLKLAKEKAAVFKDATGTDQEIWGVVWSTKPKKKSSSKR